MSRYFILGFTGAVSVLAAVLVIRYGGSSREDVVQLDDDAQTSVSRRAIASVGVVTADPGRRRPKPLLASPGEDETDDEDDSRTPEERALAARIENALDDENVDAAVACAAAALKCENIEIRDSMVDTLGWFGGKALPELVPFLADSNEDVRDNARKQLSMALSDIENDVERIGVVESVIKVINDEDVLEDLASEYIGIDEKLAVESLIRVITGEASAEGVAKAKETYEFVTGDEWSGEKEAMRWIAEEYEPPEEAH